MTDRDTTPAERVQAYLDARDDRGEHDYIDARPVGLGDCSAILRPADLRAVLAEHQAMRDTLERLRTYIDRKANQLREARREDPSYYPTSARLAMLLDVDDVLGTGESLVGGRKQVDDA